MKIRSDFVTNSSSSSFILGFKSEDTIQDELENAFPKYALDKFYTVLDDVSSGVKLTKDELIDRLKKELHWEATWEVQRLYLKNHTYEDWFNYRETEQWEAELQLYIDNIINDILGQSKDMNIFVEVEYDDHCNGHLEHEVMPRVTNVIRTISHH